jgi:glycosyltransferase involved in cell wall biosynthesis
MKTYIFYTSTIFGKEIITGGTRRFLELLHGLLEKGDIIHLFVPKQAEIIGHPNLIRHNVYAFNSKILPNGLLNFVINYFKLLSINKLKYDRLITIGLPYALQCALLNLKKIVYIVWEDFIEYRLISLDQKRIPVFLKKYLKIVLIHIGKRLEKFTLLRVSKINVQCEFDKKNLLERHKEISERIINKFHILYNNVDPSWIISQNYLMKGKCKIRKESEVLKICFIGNIGDMRKGLHILLNAVERIIRIENGVELNIIGGGPLLNYYREKYKDFKQIHFFGSLPNPIPELIKNDLLIVPSLADSFPNTVMEALYFEVPVIGSNRGGIPEMLKFEELLFNVNDDSLYVKIKEIFKENILINYKELCKQRKLELSFDWINEMKHIFDL